MTRRALRATVALGVLLLCGCGSTSSTEVGVRTSLFGVLEKRGEQQIYEPGGVYFFLPIVNSWYTLPISQQNLLMNANPGEGDRPVPDDITFKTKDGNNVYIDVNVMWRVDPKRAGSIVSQVGQSVDEIKERLLRPISRSVIRDVFNEITSEEYYHVSVKNRVAARDREGEDDGRARAEHSRAPAHFPLPAGAAPGFTPMTAHALRMNAMYCSGVMTAPSMFSNIFAVSRATTYRPPACVSASAFRRLASAAATLISLSPFACTCEE